MVCYKIHSLESGLSMLRKRDQGYQTLEVFGPEHEYSIIDEQLQPMPIVDQIIKKMSGKVTNTVEFSDFAFSKELQLHVAEIKATTPFFSPSVFEETMNQSVLEISSVLESFGVKLMGLGMHPTLTLDKAKIWEHDDREIYEAYDKIFGLRQHGWLNIQSYQLNLPYLKEKEAVRLYNAIANILPYLPAISASSPIYESKFGELVDNRLHFYSINQEKVPSISGDIIPKYIDSFEAYMEQTIRRYSSDLKKINAPEVLINKEWVNSRGAIIRFDRKAIEIRIMDEQECIKSDVALSCFIRSLLRGVIEDQERELSHPLLVDNLHTIMRDGLKAKIHHPKFKSVQGFCRFLFDIAYESAFKEEKKYLWIIKKRIENGNLSDLITDRVKRRMQKTDLTEAIFSTYSKLAEKLLKNQIFE